MVILRTIHIFIFFLLLPNLVRNKLKGTKVKARKGVQWTSKKCNSYTLYYSI